MPKLCCTKMVLVLHILLEHCLGTLGEHILICQSITLRYNPVYLSYASTNVTTPHNLSFNFEGEFIHEACENTVILDIKGQEPQKKHFINLMYFKFKIRDLISGLKNNFFRSIQTSLDKFTNMPKKCPTAANFLWYFHNYTFPINKLPIVMPEANFISMVKVLRPNNDFIFQTVLKGRVADVKKKIRGK